MKNPDRNRTTSRFSGSGGLTGIGRGEVSKYPGHVFVKRGDVALTRALMKRGAIRVISKRGKRIEQVGVAALPEWIEAAKAEVEASAPQREIARERGRVARAAKEAEYRVDFAAAVRQAYPAIPETDLAAVVDRALEVSSGRVGRTAAAKALAGEPVKLALLAHVRHTHTDYDRMLRRAGLGQRFGRASREDRQKARKAIKKTIAAKLAEWAGTRPAPQPALPADVSAVVDAGAARVNATPTAASTPTASSTPTAASTPTAPVTVQTGLFAPAPVAAEPAKPVRRTAPARPIARETKPRFEQTSLWQRPLG